MTPSFAVQYSSANDLDSIDPSSNSYISSDFLEEGVTPTTLNNNQHTIPASGDDGWGDDPSIRRHIETIGFNGKPKYVNTLIMTVAFIATVAMMVYDAYTMALAKSSLLFSDLDVPVGVPVDSKPCVGVPIPDNGMDVPLGSVVESVGSYAVSVYNFVGYSLNNAFAMPNTILFLVNQYQVTHPAAIQNLSSFLVGNHDVGVGPWYVERPQDNVQNPPLMRHNPSYSVFDGENKRRTYLDVHGLPLPVYSQQNTGLVHSIPRLRFLHGAHGNDLYSYRLTRWEDPFSCHGGFVCGVPGFPGFDPYSRDFVSPFKPEPRLIIPNMKSVWWPWLLLMVHFLSPEEIAEWIERLGLTREETAMLLGLLAPGKAAEVLALMDSRFAAKILQKMDEEVREAILIEMLRYAPSAADTLIYLLDPENAVLLKSSGSISTLKCKNSKNHLKQRIQEPNQKLQYNVPFLCLPGFNAVQRQGIIRDLPQDYRLAALQIQGNYTSGNYTAEDMAALFIDIMDLHFERAVNIFNAIIGPLQLEIAQRMNIEHLAPLITRLGGEKWINVLQEYLNPDPNTRPILIQIKDNYIAYISNLGRYRPLINEGADLNHQEVPATPEVSQPTLLNKAPSEVVVLVHDWKPEDIARELDEIRRKSRIRIFAGVLGELALVRGAYDLERMMEFWRDTIYYDSLRKGNRDNWFYQVIRHLRMVHHPAAEYLMNVYIMYLARAIAITMDEHDPLNFLTGKKGRLLFYSCREMVNAALRGVLGLIGRWSFLGVTINDDPRLDSGCALPYLAIAYLATALRGSVYIEGAIVEINNLRVDRVVRMYLFNYFLQALNIGDIIRILGYEEIGLQAEAETIEITEEREELGPPEVTPAQIVTILLTQNVNMNRIVNVLLRTGETHTIIRILGYYIQQRTYTPLINILEEIIDNSGFDRELRDVLNNVPYLQMFINYLVNSNNRQYHQLEQKIREKLSIKNYIKIYVPYHVNPRGPAPRKLKENKNLPGEVLINLLKHYINNRDAKTASKIAKLISIPDQGVIRDDDGFILPVLRYFSLLGAVEENRNTYLNLAGVDAFVANMDDLYDRFSIWDNIHEYIEPAGVNWFLTNALHRIPADNNTRRVIGRSIIRRISGRQRESLESELGLDRVADEELIEQLIRPPRQNRWTWYYDFQYIPLGYRPNQQY